MTTFTQRISVSFEDLDELEHVNNVRYLFWVQEIAKAHWQSLAPEALQQEDLWVVLSHYIEYKHSAVLGDVIELKTYVEKSEGVTSVRIVEMFHVPSGKLVVKATTNWCLLQAETKRPARIPQSIYQLFHN